MKLIDPIYYDDMSVSNLSYLFDSFPELTKDLGAFFKKASSLNHVVFIKTAQGYLFSDLKFMKLRLAHCPEKDWFPIYLKLPNCDFYGIPYGKNKPPLFGARPPSESLIKIDWFVLEKNIYQELRVRDHYAKILRKHIENNDNYLIASFIDTGAINGLFDIDLSKVKANQNFWEGS